MPTATCQCGAVRLAIARKLRALTSCNCAICRRYGALWAYCGGASIKVECDDPNALVAYRRREGAALAFHHCGRCGCVMFHERKAGAGTRVGVNARMIDPADLDGLPIRFLDGARDDWRYRRKARRYAAASGGFGP